MYPDFLKWVNSTPKRVPLARKV